MFISSKVKLNHYKEGQIFNNMDGCKVPYVAAIYKKTANIFYVYFKSLS